MMGALEAANGKLLFGISTAYIFASSKEPVGDIRFRQFAKCVVQPVSVTWKVRKP